MNENANPYLNHLASSLTQWGQKPSDILPILTEVYESGLEGNLCVPLKREWEQILKTNEAPFIIQSIDGKAHVYFERIHSLKLRLETALKKQIQSKNSIKIDTKKKDSIQKELEARYSKELNFEFKLNEGQSKAIHQTLISNFQIISGGPGTGKTTVVAFLLRIMKELGILPEPEDIALVAPTGRAAQRLTESIQTNLKRMGSEQEFNNLFHGQTVHSLLSFRKREGVFYYNKERSLPYRLILVDEVSMMDLDLMVSLFEALDNIEADEMIPFHLILLGDPNQLPSVEKGEVLADFLNELPKKGQFLSHLTDSNRHSSQSQIFQLMKFIFPDDAGNFMNTISPHFETVITFEDTLTSKEDVLWLDVALRSASETKRDLILEQIWKNHFIPQMEIVHHWNFNSEDSLKKFSIEIFVSELNRFRCLTIFRSGYYGIEGIQSKIQNLALSYFNKKQYTKGLSIQYRDLASRLYYEGMPIIITKNDRSRKLFNGDVGFICRIADELRAVFCINNQLFSFAIDTLPLHEAAFFMTVHKSQGSEYDTVLFYLPEIHPQEDEENTLKKNNRLLNKKILYTAVTRAKKKVILACDKKTWDTGLANNPKRITGFQIY
jgi:exodeoxyribonuclease V alpha subunit